MRRVRKRWSTLPLLVGVGLLLGSCVTIEGVTPGDGAITVDFTLDDGCPGCTVVAEASVDASFAVIAGSASGVSSPLTITGLTNGTPYFVRAYASVLTAGVRSEFVDDGGTRYFVHTFSTVGQHEVVAGRAINGGAILAVGGGGAGGASAGGGGGAGGAQQLDTGLQAVTYTITVGAGGQPSSTNGPEMDGGASSVVSTAFGGQALIALGGGGGMSMQNDFPGPGGRDGGSGGGGTRSTNVGNASSVGTAGGAGEQPTSASEGEGFGNAGGAGLGSSGSDTQGGGGGGAGGAGATPVVSGPGGDGGAGRVWTITGTAVTYAGGGGGGVGSSYARAGEGGSGVEVPEPSRPQARSPQALTASTGSVAGAVEDPHATAPVHSVGQVARVW